MRFSDAEISGEGLQDQAEQARQGLRDLERSVHESEYAERALQTRIADLKRNLQLARDQAQRAQDELDGLQGELFELDASARSEEHTSELQSLMRSSYAVFCLKQQKQLSIKVQTQNLYKKQT